MGQLPGGVVAELFVDMQELYLQNTQGGGCAETQKMDMRELYLQNTQGGGCGETEKTTPYDRIP